MIFALVLLAVAVVGAVIDHRKARTADLSSLTQWEGRREAARRRGESPRSLRP